MLRILFAVSHFGFLRNFESGLRTLAERRHHVHLLADRSDALGGMRTINNLIEAHPTSFAWSIAPGAKAHRWRALGVALRLCQDYWRYLEPEYDQSPALRARGAAQVPAFARPLAHSPLARIPRIRRRLARVIKRLERAIPPSPHVDRILADLQPDVLVITPLLYFGSQQVDYVRAARARGIPVMLAVGSWDHLTTKGLIHEVPDHVTVWNEAQRVEAERFHGVAADRVIVTGSTAYDHWFTTTPTLDRAQFCARIGVLPDRPLLLYLCSSPFIAPYEVGFVRKWLSGLRHSDDEQLRSVSVLIRPHPQNADQWKEVDLSNDCEVAIWPRAGANPLDRDARLDYFHSMFYSAAVVGVNTSALIESGIVGRPVYTIKADEFAATQEGTLHFHHLTNVNGGLLSTANTLEEHYQQLSSLLGGHEAASFKGRAFIEAFIRPYGLDQPAAPRFADAVEHVAAHRLAPVADSSFATRVLRRVLFPLALVAQRASRRPKVEPSTPEPETTAKPVRRLLFVMASPEYLRFYDATIRHLAASGVQVLVAVNAQRNLKQARLEPFAGQAAGVTFVGHVPPRGDMWTALADAVRGTMDFVRYLDPRFANAPVLRARIKRKCLPRALYGLDWIRSLPPAVVRALLRSIASIERAIPVSGAVRAFVESSNPDAVLVTPLVDAASDQVDTIQAAKALGLPTGAAIASWDNLTNKGVLRVQPDLVTVWNPIQVDEAVELHGVRRERVVITGAQPFDRWFEKTPSRSRDAFCAMLQLDASKPIVLFTGSSFFISGEETEVPFVRKWLEALRACADRRVSTANVLIRPHPYNADQWAAADVSDLGPAAIYPRGRHNPTEAQNRDDFFDSLFHADAIVGVNTSAMIEAAIVGRPVHAVLTSDFAGTQEGTIHFRYLLPENGGFLRVARSFAEHFEQLARSLADKDTAREETQRFVASFIRPLGTDRPCVPILSNVLHDLAARGRLTPERASIVSLSIRSFLWLPVRLWSVVGRGTQGARGARKRLRMAFHHARKRARSMAHDTWNTVARLPRKLIDARTRRTWRKRVRGWRETVNLRGKP